MNQGLNVGDMCWGINESKESMGEKIEVSGRLNVAINSHRRAKIEKYTISTPSQTHIPQFKEVALQGINEGAHALS